MIRAGWFEYDAGNCRLTKPFCKRPKPSCGVLKPKGGLVLQTKCIEIRFGNVDTTTPS